MLQSHLPPLHALPELRHLLTRIRFPENIQVLMPYQVKIILLPEPLLPRALHLPLELYDILAQDEPCLKEAHQHPRRDGHEMLVPARIAHQHGAVLSELEDTHALLCNLPHLLISSANSAILCTLERSPSRSCE